MAYAYRPPKVLPTALILLKPEYKNVGGVRKKVFQSPKDGKVFNASFKTYGGTERDVNGVYVIVDTAEIETWYDPDITSECGVALASDPSVVYEIIGAPENIEMRNQYMKFKVSRVKGGA